MENVQFSRKSDSAGKTGEKDRVNVVTDVSLFWRLIIWNNRLIIGRSERLMSAISISLHASHAFKVIFSKVSVFSSWKTRAEAAGCLFGALNPETSVFVRLRSAQLPSAAQTRLQDVIRDVVVNANMWNVKAGDSVSETKTEQSASSASFIRSNPVFS